MGLVPPQQHRPAGSKASRRVEAGLEAPPARQATALGRQAVGGPEPLAGLSQVRDRLGLNQVAGPALEVDEAPATAARAAAGGLAADSSLRHHHGQAQAAAGHSSLIAGRVFMPMAKLDPHCRN